jgi:hypothetical protein
MATAPKISNLPAAPNRQQPANFSAKGDALLSSLQGFATDANALGDYVEGAAEQVAIDKAAVDANVPLLNDAKAAAPLALSYRDTAKTYKDAAAVSEAKALQHKNDAASAVVYQNLASIALSKNITMVDGCIDTSPNPPISVQRRTGWYNETLGTATRGTRREMPVKKVVILERAKLTIYDGDDPLLPMWMHFDGVSAADMLGTGSSGSENTCVDFKNGLMGVGATIYGFVQIDFARDNALRFRENTDRTYSGYYLGGIADRNDHRLWDGTDPKGVIASEAVNDLFLTVRPNAPVDPVSGLPVPTVALATGAGVSVILEDGRLFDSALTAFSNVLDFNSYGIWYGRGAGVQLYYASWDDVSAGDGFGDRFANEIAGTDAFDLIARADSIATTDYGLALGGLIDSGNAKAGLMLHRPDYSNQSRGMSAFVTSKKNTGWMPNKCLGAYMCDTATEPLSGAQLVPFSDFSNNGAWSLGSGWSISGDKLTRSGVTEGNDSFIDGLLIPGARYVIVIDVTSVRHTSTLYVKDTTYYKVISEAVVGVHSVEFTAPSTGELRIRGGSDSDFDIDSLVVYRAAEDASVKTKGLRINGTVLREPVATGADLTGYGPFSGDNYLYQPYNANFDFGDANDFTISFWVYLPILGSGQKFLFHRCDPDLEGGIIEVRKLNGDNLRLYFGATGYSNVLVLETTKSLKAGWSKVTVQREGSLFSTFVDDTPSGSVVSTRNISNPSGEVNLGVRAIDGALPFENGKLALLKISRGVLGPEQRGQAYRDELEMFRPNSRVTLYGAKDGVKCTAEDIATGIIHVGTSAGRSDLAGLVRVGQADTPITTKIVAHDGMILEQ